MEWYLQTWAWYIEKKRKEKRARNHSNGVQVQCSIFHSILLCSLFILGIFESVLHTYMYYFVHRARWSVCIPGPEYSLSRMTTFVCLFHQAVVYMLKHIASSNGGAIITGLLCLAILIALKKVNERFKNKLPVPIPAELLVVMFDLILFFIM